jgi:hypothetical protein
MVDMLELQRFSATTKENVGDPTMKVTVEHRLSVFEPTVRIRTEAGDSNESVQFE